MKMINELDKLFENDHPNEPLEKTIEKTIKFLDTFSYGDEWDDLSKEYIKRKRISKETIKLTKESAIQMGLNTDTALGAARNIIKANFSEMMAGLLATEIGTKGFFGVLTAGIGAGIASQLFNSLVPSFATGGDFVTSGKQSIMVGDNPSGRERVQVTPLGGDPNYGNPSGSAITVNVSGNVMTQDFVEGDLAEAIRQAARRGTDFGVS